MTISNLKTDQSFSSNVSKEIKFLIVAFFVDRFLKMEAVCSSETLILAILPCGISKKMAQAVTFLLFGKCLGSNLGQGTN
jgi:hypothetical protein